MFFRCFRFRLLACSSSIGLHGKRNFLNHCRARLATTSLPLVTNGNVTTKDMLRVSSCTSFTNVSHAVSGERYSSNTPSPDRAESLNVTYRVATLDDYEDIMAIGRDLFDGLDYLPATYEMLTNDPSWTGMCVIIDGKVIGYSGYHLINGGAAVMLRAGRIVEKFRHLGVMRRKMQDILMKYADHHPSVIEAYSTLKSDSFQFQTRFYSDTDCQVFRRVGFNGAHVVDGGHSVVFRSTRFLSDYRGKSAMKGVVVAHSQLILATYPKVQSFCSTVKSDSHLMASDYWKTRYVEAFSRHCVAYKFSGTAGSDAPRQFETEGSVQDVDKTAMSAIFKHPASATTLFKDGFINSRYIFMKPVVDNVDFLYRMADQKYATYQANGECKVLTLGVHFPCYAGYVYHIECYGGTSSDQLTPHLRRHLKAAFDATKADKNTDLVVFLYGRKNDYDFTFTNDIMRRYGATPYELSYDCYVGLRHFVNS